MWIYSSGFPKSQDIGKSIERTEKKRADNALGIKRSKIESGPKTNCPKCNKTLNGTNQNNCSEQQCDLRDALAPADNAWAGWGTQLKPAHEPIALARKPMKGSIKDNVVKWGTGAININAARVPYADEADLKLVVDWAKKYTSPGVQEYAKLDGSVERTRTEEQFKSEASTQGRFPSNVLGEIPDYQKYFYCPKVSRKERHIGFDTTDIPTNPDGMWDDGVQFQEKKQGISTEASMLSDMGGYYIDEQGNETKLTGKNIWLPQTGNIYVHGLKEEYRKWCVANGNTPNVGNNHPTVKPIELMKYLIKLITPPGGTVLDPFNGSGSTGCAAVELGFEYIGCELDPAYVDISLKRIAAWTAPETEHNNFETLFE
jgi:site-specific DNA-methyltransferase (adenine-specific)